MTHKPETIDDVLGAVKSRLAEIRTLDEPGRTPNAYAHLEFVDNAPADIAALLRVIERLRAQRGLATARLGQSMEWDREQASDFDAELLAAWKGDHETNG